MNLTEVLDIPEKRTFIETLLVIAGIMTGFDSSPFKTTLFVIFAISTISYIVWISPFKNKKNKQFTKWQSSINWAFSLSVGIFFSAIIFFVGMRAGLTEVTKNEFSTIIIVGWIILYILLTVLLTLVLGFVDSKTKSLKK